MQIYKQEKKEIKQGSKKTSSLKCYVLQYLFYILVIIDRASLSNAQNQFTHASVKHDFIHLS